MQPSRRYFCGGWWLVVPQRLRNPHEPGERHLAAMSSGLQYIERLGKITAPTIGLLRRRGSQMGGNLPGTRHVARKNGIPTLGGGQWNISRKSQRGGIWKSRRGRKAEHTERRRLRYEQKGADSLVNCLEFRVLPPSLLQRDLIPPRPIFSAFFHIHKTRPFPGSSSKSWKTKELINVGRDTRIYVEAVGNIRGIPHSNDVPGRLASFLRKRGEY